MEMYKQLPINIREAPNGRPTSILQYTSIIIRGEGECYCTLTPVAH